MTERREKREIKKKTTGRPRGVDTIGLLEKDKVALCRLLQSGG